MHLLLSSLVLSTLALSLPAQEAKHIMTSTGYGLPEEADFSVKPMGYEAGITLSFAVKGANLISVNESSLQTSDRGWKLGSFPKIQENGNLGTFSISKKGNYLGKEAETKVKGSVKVVTGSKTESKSFTLKKGADPITVKDMKVSLILGGDGFFQQKGVKVVGNFDQIKSIEVKQGGKTLNQGGSSWSGERKTFNFENIKDGASVTIIYWTDLQEKTITFEKS